MSYPIGVVGSKNTTTHLHFDVLAEAMNSPLLGLFVKFTVKETGFSGSANHLMAIAQITSIERINAAHEMQVNRLSLKTDGKCEGTEDDDYMTGLAQVIGAYRIDEDGNSQKVVLSVPPASGTILHLLSADDMKDVLSKHTEMSFIGTLTGSDNVPCPTYDLDFGDVKAGSCGEGANEAIFGPPGSGKTRMSAVRILQYARRTDMGIGIFDPQGEFAENKIGAGKNPFDFHKLLKISSRSRFNPKDHVIRLHDIQLEGELMFVQILRKKRLFRLLGVEAVINDDAVEEIAAKLFHVRKNFKFRPGIRYAELNSKVTLTIMDAEGEPRGFTYWFCQALAELYSASSRLTHLRQLDRIWQSKQSEIEAIWDDAASYFRLKSPTGAIRKPLASVLKDIMVNGKIYIINIDPATINMEDDFKVFLMNFVMSKLRQQAKILFQEGKPANSLFVIDEAGRFCPQDVGASRVLAQLSARIEHSVMELRKMRIGFLLVTQYIREIKKNVFASMFGPNSLRIYGAGLGVGVDADYMADAEGREIMNLYRQIPPPRMTGVYRFLVAGGSVAMGSTGKPFIVEGFPSEEAFVTANAHIFPPAVMAAYADDEAEEAAEPIEEIA